MPYFDRARVEYLRHLDLLVRERGDTEFVIRAQQVEYHAPASFDDQLEVFVRVSRLGRTSMTWEFAAENVATGRQLVTATQTQVQVDVEGRRPSLMSTAVRDAITQFEQEVET